MEGADPESLIQAIETRPCIWDTFSPEYHDRQKTRAAWEEIATQFYPEFPVLTDSEKNSIVLLVQRKWRNMRDSYVKDLRLWHSKSKQAKRRKYIFFDRLSFLRRSVEAKMSRGPMYLKKERDTSDNSQSDEDAYVSANISDVEIIDPKALIAVVENTPSIWDASCPEYHDRAMTKEGWLNVCRTFYPHYDDLQESDRINLLGSIQKKWRHFRDCFVKDWKTSNETTARGSRLRRRKHVYYDRLSFLAKSLEWKIKNNPQCTIFEDSIDDMSCQDYDAAVDGSDAMGEEELHDHLEFSEVEKKFNPNEHLEMERDVDQKFYPICSISNSPQHEPSSHRRHSSPVPTPEQPLAKEITREVTMFQVSKETSNQTTTNNASHSKAEGTSSGVNHVSGCSVKRESPEHSSRIDLRQIEELRRATNRCLNNPLLVDEDVSFFFSILPTVRKFDEDMKLVFKAEVIKLIQNMKEQIKSSNPASS